MLPLSCLSSQLDHVPVATLWLDFETQPYPNLHFEGDSRIECSKDSTWHECTGGLPTFIERWTKDTDVVNHPDVGGYEMFLAKVKQLYFNSGSRYLDPNDQAPRIFEMIKRDDFSEKAYVLRQKKGQKSWVLEEYCSRRNKNVFYPEMFVEPHQVLYRFPEGKCRPDDEGRYEPLEKTKWDKLPFPENCTYRTEAYYSEKDPVTGAQKVCKLHELQAPRTSTLCFLKSDRKFEVEVLGVSGKYRLNFGMHSWESAVMNDKGICDEKATKWKDMYKPHYADCTKKSYVCMYNYPRLSDHDVQRRKAKQEAERRANLKKQNLDMHVKRAAREREMRRLRKQQKENQES